MKIIDFHTHIYPDNIAKKGSQSICDFYGLNYHYDGSASVLMREGRRAGISGFLLLPVAVKAEHVRHINEFTAGEVKKHEEFYGFGTVHADMRDIVGEVEEIKRLGLRGVKIHPDTQGFAIDDERLYPMYDALGGTTPVMIHCGDPRYDYSRPERVRKILEDFPKLKVIAAHLGGWSMFREAYECLADKECWLDISSCMMFLGRSETARYVNAYGADRILFGTDFPLWNPSKEVERLLSLNLKSADIEKIAHLNAEKILDIEEPQR